MTNLAVVVTTINPPSPAMREWSERLAPLGAPMVVVGDRKGPEAFELDGARFLSLDDQLADGPELARKLPTGQYSRKNLGYLTAIGDGIDVLYETDDDNAPTADWEVRDRQVDARPVTSGDRDGWVNAYAAFTDENIWPRGLPLDAILDDDARPAATSTSPTSAVVQQGLADGSPDVDAIWRLTQDRPFTFERAAPLVLDEGVWCPFNSQTTWWWPPAWPLLYLPSLCSFRMTDIWRSFVAQRCLWAMGERLEFHAPEVHQDRNEHDLQRDFVDEVPGYEQNREIGRLLLDLELEAGDDPDVVGGNLRRCWQRLSEAEVVPTDELDLVDAWLDALEQLR